MIAQKTRALYNYMWAYKYIYVFLHARGGLYKLELTWPDIFHKGSWKVKW